MIEFYRLLSESPNMRKISLMLQAVDLPHTVKNIDPHNKEQHDAKFLEISPSGTVPAIFDTETNVSLFESGAILFYLAEKSNKLLPTNIEGRAEVLKWLMFEVSNVCPAMIELHHYYLHDTGDIPDSVFQRYKDTLTQCCSILNKQLDNKEYLCGEYSIADIALYPWMVTLEDMAEINLHNYPNLNKWSSIINDKF